MTVFPARPGQIDDKSTAEGHGDRGEQNTAGRQHRNVLLRSRRTVDSLIRQALQQRYPPLTRSNSRHMRRTLRLRMRRRHHEQWGSVVKHVLYLMGLMQWLWWRHACRTRRHRHQHNRRLDDHFFRALNWPYDSGWRGPFGDRECFVLPWLSHCRHGLHEIDARVR
jgi:hypothetical protein